MVAFEICAFIRTTKGWIFNFIRVDATHQCCISAFPTWEIPSKGG